MPAPLRFFRCPPRYLSLARIARRVVVGGAVLCCTMSLSGLTRAAALGEATVHSALGQSLDVDIAIASLSSAEADSLTVRIAPASAFADAGIDYTPLMRSLRVLVEKRGEFRRVRILSDLPVQDPFLRLLVDLSAGGSRMVREYTLLIDPPLIDTRAGNGRGDVSRSADTAATTSGMDSLSAPTSPTPPTVSAPASPPASDTPLTVQSGTLPARAVNEAAAATRVVRRGDTLRAIGAELRPQEVQLEQVMIALMRANPDAFIDGNIHRVRRGSVLRVPAIDAMRSVEPAAARRILRTQAVDFRRHQRQLAQRGSADAAAAGNRSSGGQIGVRTDTAVPATQQQDKLNLSAPGVTERADAKPSPVDALDKIASDKALADANSRIAALEKNIGQLQKMLEVRNSTLSDVQQRATQATGSSAPPAAPKGATAGPAVPDVPPPYGTPKTVTEPTAATEPTQVTAESQSSTSEVPPASQPSAEPAGDSAGERAAEAPKSRSAKPNTPTPPARRSATVAPSLTEAMLDEPLARIAVPSLLLLLLAWGGLRWRRRRQPAGMPAAEPLLPAQTVIAGAGGRHVDTRHSEFHSNFVPSVSQIDASEVDAVAEADVYIAYGRDEQAEEILLDALRIHPERDALRVKLLEIYAARKDRQKFGTLAAEVRVRTHGEGSDWEKAAQLGRQLDPTNHLFDAPATRSSFGAPGGSPSGFASGSDPGLTPGATSGATSGSALTSPVDDFGLRLAGLLDEQRTDGSVPTGCEPMRETAPSNGIEFSLAGIDAGSPASGVSTDSTALNTKLELALACKEIGDLDGARELLTEVAGSAHAELARRAQSLLDQLA